MKTATKKTSLDRVIRSINIQTQRKTLRPLLEWIAYHKVCLRAGIPFDLAGHEYLREIYEDTSPERVFKKAAQIGMSTAEVLRALWYADQYVCKSIYYFPTNEDVEDFGDDRMDPLIQETEYFRDLVRERAERGGTYKKGLKQIGKSSIYMRGLWTKRAAKSVDADILVFDEVDEIKPEMMEYAQDRVLHSQLGFMSWLSQPSLPGVGIDAEFSLTDQRHWMLKCAGCGSWNCLEKEFPQDFKEQSPHFIELTGAQAAIQGRSFYRGCSKCGHELDMAAGQWVQEFPDRTRRGYWISGLYTQVRSKANPEPADKIMKQYRKARTVKQKERFVVSIVGDAYGGDSKKIDDMVLKKCEAPYLMGPGAGYATGLGVDVGDIKHVLVRGRSAAGKKRILWVELTPSWERIAEIVRQFWPPNFICDAMPYKDNAKDLCRAFPGRGRIQYFQDMKKEDVKEEERKKDSEEDGVAVIAVDRTETLDQTVTEIADGLIELPSLQLHSGDQAVAIEELHKHLKHLIADLKEDARGMKRRIYRTNVPNHFGMAANSARIAEGLPPLSASTGVLPVFGEIH